MPGFTHIGFIGAGRLGTTLAEALARHGYRIAAVSSRSHASAARLANATGQAPLVCNSPQLVADRCDLVFITTPDNAVREIADTVSWRKGQGAVHCSGALTIAALAPATGAGAQTAGFHPMQTFTAAGQTLDGVTIAIEGSGPLAEALTQMAREIGGAPVAVASEDKSLYHISGVFASNYVVTLMNLAEELWEAQGLSRAQARQALLTLLKGTLANIEQAGSAQALTGPIARGDDTAIAAHLETLATKAPALLALYRELGQHTIPVAEAKGAINERTAQKLRAILSGLDGRIETSRSASAPQEGLR
jgi:predicted short-subunit dehydrogenase-like oxidoreductase (DUF2520 family)